jgi:hypothetical protein
LRAERAARRRELGVSEEVAFRSKPEMGWELLRRQLEEDGLPVEVGCGDPLYRRSPWLRAQLRGAGILYLAEVPCDPHVSLRRPWVSVPRWWRRQGRAPTRVKVLSPDKPVEVRALKEASETVWRRLTIRATERGLLRDQFVAQTKLDWAKTSARDPELARVFEVEVLPALSMANVRMLLQAVLPLPQLTPQQATDLGIEQLINWTRSRKSRLKQADNRPCVPPPDG